MTRYNDLKRMIDAARERRLNQESEYRKQEIAAIQRWSAQFFSTELSTVLKWSPGWDEKERIAYLEFSVMVTGSHPHMFRLYPANLAPHRLTESARGQLALLASLDIPIESAVISDEDTLLIAIGEMLTLAEPKG